MDLPRELLRLLGRNQDSDEEEEEERMPLLGGDEMEDISEDSDGEEEEEDQEGSERAMSSDEDEAGTNETAAAPVPTKDEGNKAKNTTPKKKSRKGRVEFDISLPAQHLYLGDLEDDGPANMEDEEATPTLPLLCIPSRILFPGETLPMHIHNPHLIPVLRDASTRNKPVAVCTDLRVRHSDSSDHQPRPLQQELAGVGTTAEVLAFREEESRYYYGQYIVVKFLGRQRFKLLELHRKVNGLMDCRVQILPEQYIPARPSHLTSCPTHILASCQAVQVQARQEDCSLSTLAQLENCRRLMQRPCLTASLTPVPSWVYNCYDLDHLREELLMEKELKTFSSEDTSGVSHLPADVSSLSYWLARRLPVGEMAKLDLLSIDCPTFRLIKAMHMLKEFTDLRCVDCQTVITHKRHMFSMSVDGPLAAYVNPGGYVHDTLTVTEVKSLKKQGLSSTEHSWFPGYKWTILVCRSCGHHRGWLFEATKKNLVPTKFYGLTRQGLVLTSPQQSISDNATTQNT